MKMKFIVGLVCLLVSNNVWSQTVNVKFTVTKNNNEVVQNSSAQILKNTDSSVLFSKILKQNTAFNLVANTDYFVRITAVGIAPIFKKIQVLNADTTIAMNAIATSKNLDAVVVKSTKPLVRQEDDKTIVDAEPIASTSTNAYEVLEKTPGAILDQDGNVYLNSATPAAIQINGREVKLSAQDLTTLLKSLPANSILKIEILRTPSAKYDAASSGGIVNIVLKKGVKLGTNGSVEASYYQGKYATKSTGFNINKNDSKINTYLSYSITRRENFFTISSDRINNASNILFKQNALTNFKATSQYLGGGLDYKINNKWNLNYDLRISSNAGKNNVSNEIDIFKLSNNAQVGKNTSLIQNADPTLFVGNTVTAKLKIDSAGSEWTNSLEYTYFTLKNEQQYQNLNINPARNTLFGDGDIANKKNIFVFKSDAVFKLKNKLTIEVGAKFNYTKSNNNAVFYADTSTGKYLNTFQTNKFKYSESIAAAYFQVAKTFGKFTIKPGIRLEQTDIIGNQIVPRDTTFTIKRTNLFPYLYLKREIAKVFGFKLIGNLIYRRSITRPFYEALNPTARYADQYTYDIGNPNLQPQFTNNYELNITANEFPIFSVGVNAIENIFTNLTYQKDKIVYRTFDNVGSNKEVYLRLVGGIPPGGKYFFYAGTQMNRINYDGLYSSEIFKYKRSSWNIFTYHNYKVTPTLNISLNGWMRLHGVNNFFETKNFGALNLSVNKTFLKNKFSVNISGNDILRTNRVYFNIDVPKFAGSGLQYTDTRKFGIALKYSFGIKPKVEQGQGFEAPKDLN
jgi:iron complex outermembrane recepter protein